MTELKNRFRGFLPVVVDIETAGVNPNQHALLEIAIVLIEKEKHGLYTVGETHFEHVLPFEGALLDKTSLDFNQIDPYQPLRFALPEKEALLNLFKPIHKQLKKYSCRRAVLVGHNAWFDLLFLKSATKRAALDFPFHAFTCFDTATLSGLFFGQTVLSKAMDEANIAFDLNEAHSAIYDAEKTAALFCQMLNQWDSQCLTNTVK
jgi:ribonuclease T